MKDKVIQNRKKLNFTLTQQIKQNSICIYFNRLFSIVSFKKLNVYFCKVKLAERESQMKMRSDNK